ncbi:hypothetical protein N0V82_010658 [Gnomoniopsis sp. IMI 355080]|nr:hypothetical protein N0V82_010658 [Gnomoniopsis sp. IMI 355080]
MKQVGPLALVVEGILGPLDDPAMEKNGLHVPFKNETRGLANWYRFNHCILDDTLRPELRGLLSKAQEESYQLLWEWWTSMYQDPGITLASILELTSASECLEFTDDPTLWSSLFAHLALHKWPTGDVGVVHPLNSYHKSLLALYDAEFNGRAIYPDSEFTSDFVKVQDERLHRSREQANITSYYQKVAWLCLHNTTHVTDQGDVRKPFRSVETMWSTNPGSNSCTLMERLACQVQFGPTLERCPWLGNLENDDLVRERYPVFLWDIRRGETVRVDEIAELPRYTAISHTWGRWRLDDVEIKGVPWLVPRNSRFSVESLPQTLRNASFGTSHVWMDLLCIPQDSSPVANSEIARQGAIFQSAESSIAWLNDVASFEGLNASINWMAVQLVSLHPSDQNRLADQSNATVQYLSQIRGKSSGLAVPTPGSTANAPFRTNAWFTSLWTLQEVCLRPDMLLADASWKCVSVADNVRIPINGLITMHKFFRRSIGYSNEDLDSKFPPGTADSEYFGVWEIEFWIRATGLDNLLDLSRVDILALGSRRQCTSRRAEAIMSALGATSWYLDAIASPAAQDTRLVLDTYPLAFVREVKELLGGQFLTSLLKFPLMVYDEEGNEIGPSEFPEFALKDDLEYGTLPEKDIEKLTGSTLPFSRGGSELIRHDVFSGLELKSHDTVAEWEIDSCGHLHISSACVLATSSHDLRVSSPHKDGLIPCHFLGFETQNPPLIKNPETLSVVVDLLAWIDSRPYPVHAVVVSSLQRVLCEDYMSTIVWTNVEGVILRELKPGVIFKMGNFFSATEKIIQLPDPVKVDWIVR